MGYLVKLFITFQLLVPVSNANNRHCTDPSVFNEFITTHGKRASDVQRVWDKFNPTLNSEFKSKLATFRGSDILTFDSKMHGAQGQIFLSDKHPTLALKRFFTDIRDPSRSTRQLETLASNLDKSPTLSKNLSVVRVHEKGPDWIIRDFDRSSIQLSDILTDPAARQALLRELSSSHDPILKKVFEKLKKRPVSPNLHWSPTEKKILVIDFTKIVFNSGIFPV